MAEPEMAKNHTVNLPYFFPSPGNTKAHQGPGSHPTEGIPSILSCGYHCLSDIRWFCVMGRDPSAL